MGQSLKILVVRNNFSQSFLQTSENYDEWRGELELKSNKVSTDF